MGGKSATANDKKSREKKKKKKSSRVGEKSKDKEESSSVRSMPSDGDAADDASDEGDEYLLEAAREWAQSNSSRNDHSEPTRQDVKVWSVHLTQVSFEATDYDIREAFAKEGCLVESVRLVYDNKGRDRTFRGVAFVDVADESSHRKALTLDRKVFLGRRINVRPTKTRTELANIVAKTQEILAAKKAETQKKQTPEDHKKKKKSPSKNSEEKEHQNDEKSPKKSSKRKERHNDDDDDDDDDDESKPSKKKKDGSEPSSSTRIKLNKKQRNRRAAIILGRKKGKRK